MTRSHTHTTTQPRDRSGTSALRGFTIMELLVVIAIIGLVVGVSLPLMRTFTRNSGVTSGINTIVVSAEAARQLATTATTSLDPLSDSGSTEGSALLVTNVGEVRLLAHDSGANLAGERKGFQDVSGRDYIMLSASTRMVGIRRNGPSNNDLQFVAPPFAIRFNQYGNLVFGNPTSANFAFNVYYDADYNGGYDTTSRPANYNPYATPPVWDGTEGRFELPFGEIETVIGVMVFDIGDVPEENQIANTADGYITADSTNGKLILQHGTAIFFNRVTGAPVLRN